MSRAQRARHALLNRALVLVLALVPAASLAGCGDHAPGAPRPLPPIPPGGPGGPAGAEAVGFRSLDGTGLRGRLFGHGTTGVALAHMGNNTDSEAEWYSLARRLAREGYLALPYNRQGVCTTEPRRYDCSAGLPDYATEWKDIVGAARFLRSRGARRLVLMGASIGGTGSVYAAASGRVRADAVVSLAGVNYISTYSLTHEQVRRIPGAKLFVSARRDPDGAERSAREWYGWARAPKRLALLDSKRHGTDMLAPAMPTREPLTELLVRFLRRHAPA